MGFGVALLLPMLNLIIFQIPNAAALAVPGVVPTAKGAAQGIEATGQRLIFMIGQLLVFIVALVPAAAVFAGVFFLGNAAPSAIAIPLRRVRRRRSSWPSKPALGSCCSAGSSTDSTWPAELSRLRRVLG